jgi:hypothetical protein
VKQLLVSVHPKLNDKPASLGTSFSTGLSPVGPTWSARAMSALVRKVRQKGDRLFAFAV